MHNGLFRLFLCLIGVLLFAGIVAAGNDLTLSSPNGFPIAGLDGATVNCTFMGDGMANLSGWKLKFAGKPGDAKTWAATITNANLSFVPTPASIMVLDGFPDSPRGHVGWVTTTKKNNDGSYTITVLEGFKRDAVTGKVNKAWNYYSHSWTVTSGKNPTATVSGGSTKIPVLGFLTKK